MDIFRTLIDIFRTSMDIFPGLDISPKLPHLVLSRHRHLCRRCLAEQFHISSLHRQRRGFRVISDNLKKTPTWKYIFFLSGTTFQTSSNLTSFAGWNFWDLSGLRCASCQTFPLSCLSLLCPLFMETFTDFGRSIQQQVGAGQVPWEQVGTFLSLGVSESERERRKQSNLLTTKINFLAWIIEVTLITQGSKIFSL